MDVPDNLNSAISRREMLALSAAVVLAGCTAREDTARERAAHRALTVTEPKPVDKRPNIVLYIADSMRADHLGLYGYPFATSPNLDRLAEELIVFDNCRAPATWTKPSITSLYTGVSPSVHHVHIHSGERNGVAVTQGLPDEVRTLAELVRDGAGYETALFLANGIVNELGYERGFNHYEFEQGLAPDRQREAVESWIATNKGTPFFAVVHQLDPHGPYTPTAARYHSLFGLTPDALAQRLGAEDHRLLDMIARGEPVFDEDSALSDPAIAHLRGLYDAEIAKVEDEFSNLLNFLRIQGLLENTIVILTSDHGESFNEHGRYLHGHAPYEEQIRVPLVMRVPGGTAARVAGNVGWLDLFATILSASGVEAPAYAQGQALLDGSGAVVPPPELRPHVSWTANVLPARSDAALVLGSRKLLSYAGGTGLYVFGLKADPHERHPLPFNLDTIRDSPHLDLFHALQKVRIADQELARSFPRPKWLELAPQHWDDLEALGYV